MNVKKVSIWLKILIVGFALCGIAVYAFGFPTIGRSFAEHLGEWYERCILPWEILLWVTAIPCYAVLFIGWGVSTRIGKDKTFSNENATSFKVIGILAAVDTCIFFVGNLVLWLINMSHPGIFLVSLVVDFIGFAIAVASFSLSNLIKKAAILQSDSDLTI